MRQLKKRFFIIFSSLLLVHCGGGDGGSGSSSTEEGITATFQAQPQQSPTATGLTPTSPAGAKTFFNTEGVQITLNKAYLTLWSVQLENDCNDASFAFFNWLLPAVQAHADDSPTRMGVPNVIDLLGADSVALTLGSAGPPPGNYCGITVELSKADSDAQYLPKTVDMINRTLYIEGEYIPLGSVVSVPFVIDSERTLRESRLRYAVPLTLSSSERQATTTLSIIYDRWFDSVDFNALSEQTQQDWIFNQITDSIGLVTATLD